MADVIIREVEPGDIAALSELARKTYTETFGYSFTAAELAMQLENTRSEAYFHEAITRDTILIAVHDEAVIGYVQICNMTIAVEAATGRDQQLNALYVHSDFQGQGIGKLLMDAALTHPRLQGAENIYLDVWDKNVKALRLYKRYGFEVVGETPVLIGSRVVGSDLVMVRRSQFST